MVDYKLRLGDGTTFSVDEKGLTTWLQGGLVDDKTRIQPAGSKKWFSLKQVLAAQGAQRATAERQTDKGRADVDRQAAEETAEIERKVAEQRAAEERKAKEEVAAAEAKSAEERAAAERKLIEEPEAAALSSAEGHPQGESPGGQGVDAEAGAREAERVAEAERMVAAERAERAERKRAAEEARVAAERKAAEECAAAERQEAEAREAAAEEAERVAEAERQIAAERAERAERKRKAAEEVRLEAERQAAEEARVAAERKAAEERAAAERQEAEAREAAAREAAAREAERVAEAERLVAAERAERAERKRRAEEERLAEQRAAEERVAAERRAAEVKPSKEPSRKPAVPPPSFQKLDVIPFAAATAEPKVAEDVWEGEDASEEPRRVSSTFAGVWLWVKRVTIAAALIGTAAFLALNKEKWLPKAKSAAMVLGQEVDKLSERTSTRIVPPEAIETAQAEVPYLRPETIELIMAKSTQGVLEPPEVFRHAHQAAERARPSLPKSVAAEIDGLTGAVVAELETGEAERLRTYLAGVRAGAPTAPYQDKEALWLMRRGLRRLPAERLARMQELFAQAVTAALQPPA